MNTSICEGTLKFILNDLTYDTATATPLAVDRGVSEPDDYMAPPMPQQALQTRYENVLYRTPSGRFFVHYHSTTKYEKGKPVVEDTASALSADEALEWIRNEEAAIVNDEGLPLPPAA
ncbi:MAG: hypothetical protein K2X67_03435 [Burkholderiales bacterium]|jgi:hypothetical protein|nr:hypothetical protein [Burkholderiales bacterium]